MGRISEQQFLDSLTSYGLQVCERLTAIGKSREWLKSELGITGKTLNEKLRNNTFTPSEIVHIKQLLK